MRHPAYTTVSLKTQDAFIGGTAVIKESVPSSKNGSRKEVRGVEVREIN